MSNLREAAQRTADWMLRRVITSAKGNVVTQSDVQPEGRFWLGRLTPEAAVVNSPFGDRSERMQPCAIGIRLRPNGDFPLRVSAIVTGCVWYRIRTGGTTVWRKTELIRVPVAIEIPSQAPATYSFKAAQFEDEMRRCLNVDVIRASVRVDVERGRDDACEVVLMFVNESPESSDDLADTGIYESRLRLEGVTVQPFLLESLPDSFRYDRRVPAYGINCGVINPEADTFESTDDIQIDRPRPAYWTVEDPLPDLRFVSLAQDPITPLRQLIQSHRTWGNQAWSSTALDQRMVTEAWSPGMRSQAATGAAEFEDEARRLANGLGLLETDPNVRQSFQMMNEAMALSSRNRYDAWRPFQIGFLLANLTSILGHPDETAVVDILWFATGGGKTETYLGLLVIAAFYDRLTGKTSGITAWSRFPLRLLSLQQTQRFADAMAGAETIRRNHHIPGAPFSLGFFVGDTSTPNRIKNDPAPGEPDSLDDTMPGRFQVLLRCPFCDAAVQMGFNRRVWRLEHRCINEACSWPEDALPIFIVDEEIYRFLPTVVVGTLDKVASISMQAAMRGFVGSPYGLCSEPWHGYVYAPRSTHPNGCLVPGCRGQRLDLPMQQNRFPPTFRLQDELHLLRDSLGAIDAHYESLMDDLESGIANVHAKIVASSATLTGYERQCEVLYGRQGRVFPIQGPTAATSFWYTSTPSLLRRYVALSPRGVTLEFAADRILAELQRAIRELNENPEPVSREIGIDASLVPDVVSFYGTNVVYGNTIRDIDASVRSLETQVPVSPLQTAQLTGHTPFNEVRTILERLQRPETDFNERIHVVAASSMMSHGVDIDRLNSMVMLGLPLTTAEFIQATARIGRTWPGLVLVLHKMALERDASVFRSFRPFVEQGDRFVEAIPITRKSCRVLERTLPGIVMARLRHQHEPLANVALTLISRVRQYFGANGITDATELAEITRMLGFDEQLDERLVTEAARLLASFFRGLNDPAGNEKFPDRLFATGVMRSLRDVEEQAPIHD